MPAVTAWHEVADRIWVRRYDPFDVNVTVVAGTHGVLLVDTRTSLHEAAEVRRHLAELPVTAPTAVALTHAHLDHSLGAGAFPGLPLYASRGCRETLTRHGVAERERWLSWLDEEHHAHLRASPIPVPDHLVEARHRIDLGDRDVDLLLLGHGHTDHDLVLHVPDAAAVLAGDLVEVGAPPAFEDAFPFEWPATLARLEALEAEVVVPGHGAPTSQALLSIRRQQHAHLAALCREALGGVRSAASVLVMSPFPEDTTRVALDRAAATTGRRAPDA
ncbi:MAG: MBL fold metallo-hydrolase [Nitriliruptor sp.]|nr:MAG: MBL fold metallo-hydrolase [Nitriliruptor sp.]